MNNGSDTRFADELLPVNLDARRISPPVSISREAQAYLSAAAQQPSMPAPPSLDDKSGWKAWIAAADEAVGAMMAGFNGYADCENVVLGRVPTFLLRPQGLAATTKGVMLDIHGGGLVMGGGSVCRSMGCLMAKRTELLTYSVDYRMAPDYPYPAALDDCLSAYKALLQDYPASQIIVGGVSAGGNLAAALMLRARDEGLPLPAGVLLLTPEVDLTESGDSFQVNCEIDVALKRGLMPINILYADGHDLSEPYLSPLFGDFSRGFPPTYLQTGTRDLFLSNTVRMHRELYRHNVDTELHVFEAMPHGGFGGTAPEDEDLSESVRCFVRRCLAASAAA